MGDGLAFARDSSSRRSGIQNDNRGSRFGKSPPLRRRGSLIYPELSYKIIGSAFKVFNSLQYGHQEKYYQRALELEFKKEKIKYEKEKEVALNYADCKIGKYYLDFLIEDKIIVELKVLSSYRYKNTRQVLEYLKETNKKLAILIYFTQEGVKYRRIVNPKYDSL